MPFPLLPFVLGAAAGAALTYYLSTRGSDRVSEPAVDNPAPNEGKTPETAPDEGASGSTSEPER